MIPWFTALAGLVYCAVAIPAFLIGFRRKVQMPRSWAFCTGLAALIVLNALGGQDWLMAALWTFNGSMAAVNWRADARRTESAREFERI